MSQFLQTRNLGSTRLYVSDLGSFLPLRLHSSWTGESRTAGHLGQQRQDLSMWSLTGDGLLTSITSTTLCCLKQPTQIPGERGEGRGPTPRWQVLEEHAGWDRVLAHFFPWREWKSAPELAHLAHSPVSPTRNLRVRHVPPVVLTRLGWIAKCGHGHSH